MIGEQSDLISQEYSLKGSQISKIMGPEMAALKGGRSTGYPICWIGLMDLAWNQETPH